MAFNIDREIIDHNKDINSTTTFSLVIRTNNVITSDVIRTRIYDAIDNLGDEPEVDLRIVNTTTTQFDNQDF